MNKRQRKKMHKKDIEYLRKSVCRIYDIPDVLLKKLTLSLTPLNITVTRMSEIAESPAFVLIEELNDPTQTP